MIKLRSMLSGGRFGEPSNGAATAALIKKDGSFPCMPAIRFPLFRACKALLCFGFCGFRDGR